MSEQPQYGIPGFLTSSWAMVYNATGEPERVLTAAEVKDQIREGLVYICQRYGRGQAGW